jgi:hypothetical protein
VVLGVRLQAKARVVTFSSKSYAFNKMLHFNNNAQLDKSARAEQYFTEPHSDPQRPPAITPKEWLYAFKGRLTRVVGDKYFAAFINRALLFIFRKGLLCWLTQERTFKKHFNKLMQWGFEQLQCPWEEAEGAFSTWLSACFFRPLMKTVKGEADSIVDMVAVYKVVRQRLLPVVTLLREGKEEEACRQILTGQLFILDPKQPGAVVEGMKSEATVKLEAVNNFDEVTAWRKFLEEKTPEQNQMLILLCAEVLPGLWEKLCERTPELQAGGSIASLGQRERIALSAMSISAHNDRVEGLMSSLDRALRRDYNMSMQRINGIGFCSRNDHVKWLRAQPHLHHYLQIAKARQRQDGAENKEHKAACADHLDGVISSCRTRTSKTLSQRKAREAIVGTPPQRPISRPGVANL